MLPVNIFDVASNLRLFGFWYCVWRRYSLWDIFIASRMNKHDSHPTI